MVAKVYLEGIVEDGNARMEEAGICSKRTKTVSRGRNQPPGHPIKGQQLSKSTGSHTRAPMLRCASLISYILTYKYMRSRNVQCPKVSSEDNIKTLLNLCHFSALHGSRGAEAKG